MRLRAFDWGDVSAKRFVKQCTSRFCRNARSYGFLKVRRARGIMPVIEDQITKPSAA